MAEEKIVKKIPENPHNLVTWTTRRGRKYYVISDKTKHNVYRILEKGFQKVYSTRDYYTIEKELERLDNDEN